MISVVIPVYNEQDDIIECLKSLEKQKGVLFEVIVCDDGSDDKTLARLKEFKTKKYSLRVITQNHLGAGQARNKAAKFARGEIIAFLDADMVFDSQFIKNLVHPILKRKTKGTFSKDEIVSNWDNVWARCWNYNENWVDRKRHPENYPDEQPVFRAILKSEFLKVGGFTGSSYTDDWSLSEKLGYKASVAKSAIFYHRNPSSLKEVFKQAKWVGKRSYKFGPIGTVYAIFRSNILFSIIIGIFKGYAKRTPNFIIFKLIYDTGITLGIISFLITGKGAK